MFRLNLKYGGGEKSELKYEPLFVEDHLSKRSLLLNCVNACLPN
jgi:hypothetical protein